MHIKTYRISIASSSVLSFKHVPALQKTRAKIERKWKELPEKCCKVEKTGKEASSVHIILNFEFIHTSLQLFSVTSRSVSTGMKTCKKAYVILAILRNKRKHPTYPRRIMEASHAVNLSQLNQKHNFDRPHT